MTPWRCVVIRLEFRLFDGICTQMDQYMALSKKDLMIHITMNELYNTHALILQHIETLVSKVTVEWNLFTQHRAVTE